MFTLRQYNIGNITFKHRKSKLYVYIFVNKQFLMIFFNLSAHVLGYNLTKLYCEANLQMWARLLTG